MWPSYHNQLFQKLHLLKYLQIYNLHIWVKVNPYSYPAYLQQRITHRKRKVAGAITALGEEAQFGKGDRYLDRLQQNLQVSTTHPQDSMEMVEMETDTLWKGSGHEVTKAV